MKETRAQKAQRLVDEGRVGIVHNWNVVAKAIVLGDHDTYTVYVYPSGRFLCTCAWGGVHSYTRDLCAHALAVKLAVSLGSP